MNSVEKIEDGLVKDGTGEVYFNVTYQAVVFRPFIGEVMDGIVSEVRKDGVYFNIGPLEGAIAHTVLVYIRQYIEYAEFDDLCGKRKRICRYQ